MSLNPDVLATCVEVVRSRRLSIDECVSPYPAIAADLRAVLEVAIAIGPPPSVAMDSIARSRGRAALIAAMANDSPVVMQSSGARFLGSKLVALMRPSAINLRVDRMPALLIALVFVVTMILGGGVVAASENALPGDALYPVKLSVEDVQLAAAYGDEAKAQFALRQAAGRLAEIDRANKIGRTDAIATAAEDYVHYVAAANQHLANAAASGHDVHDAANRLNGELARQSEELAIAEGRVPASARVALAAAARAARSGINVNGNPTASPGVGSSGTVAETSTPTAVGGGTIPGSVTPTIRSSVTPGPSSVASRAPERNPTDEGNSAQTDDKHAPRATVTPRPSVEPSETVKATPTSRHGSAGSKDDDAGTLTTASSTLVLATRTPRATREPEATERAKLTKKSRPTPAAEPTQKSDSSGGGNAGGGD